MMKAGVNDGRQSKGARWWRSVGASCVLAAVATSCADEPEPAEPSASATTDEPVATRAQSSLADELAAFDPRPSPSWFEGPSTSWPRGVAEHRADLRAFGTLESGVGFLGVDVGGALVGITAAWFLTADSGLVIDADAAYLELLVKSWRMVEAGGGEGEATLGRRARSGVGAAGSDVLMLEARANPGVELPSQPLLLSTRVPNIGEDLWIASADAERAWVATVVSRHAPAAYLEFELPAGTRPDDVLGGPVLDGRGFAVACVTSVNWESDGDEPSADEVLQVGAQLLRPLLRSPPPLEGVPLRFDAPGFDCLALAPSETMLFMGSPMLGGARIVSWPEGAILASESLPKGQGAGAFTPSGRLVMAGRGGAFTLFDVVTATAITRGSVALQLATSVAIVDERLALLGSNLESGTHLVDVELGVAVERLDVWGAAVALSPDGAQVAFGGGDGTLVLAEVARGASGSWLGARRTLLPHAEDVATLAFSGDGKRLASGGLDGCVRIFETATGELLWESTDTPSDINHLVFEGSHLVVATGSIEDVGDERRAVASYVRVFDAASGAERARSHDHDTPVVALLPLERTSGGPRHWQGMTIGNDHFAWALP